MNTIHGKIQEVKCDSCEKSFGHKSLLKGHIKRVHQENEKTFKCDSCDQSFGQQGKLNLHTKCVHGNMKSYKCETCEKSFADIRVVIRIR